MIDEIKKDNFKTDIVYSLDEKDIGRVTIEDTSDTINIIDVYVEENYRRKGVATKILEFLFDKYKVRFMLEVREDNTPAIKLYEKFGFVVIHKREKYYKDADALIMEAKN